MNAERARQCLADIGCGPEIGGQVEALVEADRLMEAKQQLRILRCGLMDELHACQRRVDQLDWLIWEIENSSVSR